jgi:hypothetical protein
MADIYTLAYRVVVWLGQTTNNSKLGISTLKYIGAQVESMKTIGDITPQVLHIRHGITRHADFHKTKRLGMPPMI